MLTPFQHKSPRRTARQAEATRQIVAFCLRQEWFALPIDVVQKVLPMGNVYGDIHLTGVSLTLYEGQELLVVDVGRRIFGEAPSQNLLPASNSKDIIIQHYLLVVQSSQGELVGLAIDSSPKLRRVPESAFIPLPLAYISTTNIQCLSPLMIQTKDEPPIFLLNPDQLWESVSST